jgi:hypothetical protein
VERMVSIRLYLHAEFAIPVVPDAIVACCMSCPKSCKGRPCCITLRFAWLQV